MLAEVRSLGGEIFAITSQTERAAADAKSVWGVEYESWADPSIDIAKYLKGHGLLNIFVNTDPAPPALSGGATPGGEYQVGVYQPAVLALTESFQPLFSFAAVPCLSNAGGAGGRPTAAIVMAAVREALEGGTSSVVPWRPKAVPLIAPILLVMYFFAAGNFIRPVPPALDADGSEPPHIKKIALGKLAAAVLGATTLGCLRPRTTGLAGLAYAAYVRLLWGTWIKRFFSPASNALQVPLAGSGKHSDSPLGAKC